jgi:glycosyltransferase involved in cell wall biosynthesis
MERLSIVIPVYNKIESTLKCINSIREFNRDCTFEIIIVDNGSTDETQQVFERGSISVIPAKAGIQSRALDSPVKPENDKLVHQISSDQITYIRNEKNLGVSKALNSGAEAARYSVLCTTMSLFSRITGLPQFAILLRVLQMPEWLGFMAQRPYAKMGASEGNQ